MADEKTKNMILEGNAVLGIELGSTRIKAVLINSANEPIAQGALTGRMLLLMDIGPIHLTMSGMVLLHA